MEPTAALTATGTHNGHDERCVRRWRLSYGHKPIAGGGPRLERHSSPASSHQDRSSGLASVHSISPLGKVLRLIFASRSFRRQPQRDLTLLSLPLR